MDSTTILRKVDDQHNKYFTGIYDMHLQYKLCRDQNLIQYAFMSQIVKQNFLFQHT